MALQHVARFMGKILALEGSCALQSAVQQLDMGAAACCLTAQSCLEQLVPSCENLIWHQLYWYISCSQMVKGPARGSLTDLLPDVLRHATNTNGAIPAVFVLPSKA